MLSLLELGESQLFLHKYDRVTQGEFLQIKKRTRVRGQRAFEQKHEQGVRLNIQEKYSCSVE